MLESLVDFEKMVRDQVFNNADPSDLFTFELATSDDCSANDVGDLFLQSGDFLCFEIELDDVKRAGPGQQSPVRVWGALAVSVVSDSSHKKLQLLSKLEEVAKWFAGKTVEGVRFREFKPTGYFPLRGKHLQDGIIEFSFELPPLN